MENFITSKTVVGEAIHVGDTTILPLIEVSFGMAASARMELTEWYDRIYDTICYFRSLDRLEEVV